MKYILSITLFLCTLSVCAQTQTIGTPHTVLEIKGPVKMNSLVRDVDSTRRLAVWDSASKSINAGERLDSLGILFSTNDFDVSGTLDGFARIRQRVSLRTDIIPRIEALESHQDLVGVSHEELADTAAAIRGDLSGAIDGFYTTDGALTSDRTVDFQLHDLMFNNVNTFTVQADLPYSLRDLYFSPGQVGFEVYDSMNINHDGQDFDGAYMTGRSSGGAPQAYITADKRRNGYINSAELHLYKDSIHLGIISQPMVNDLIYLGIAIDSTGSLYLDNTETGSGSDSILVIHNRRVKKVAFADLAYVPPSGPMMAAYTAPVHRNIPIASTKKAVADLPKDTIYKDKKGRLYIK